MDINTVVSFMAEEKISSRQFLYLWSLLTDNLYSEVIEDKGKTKKILTYGKEGIIKKLSLTDPLTLGELSDLEDKEFIINLNEKGTQFFDACVLTPKFVEVFFVSRGEFEELWEAFPATIVINGSNIPARVGDYDALRDKYLSIIGKDKDTHRNIVTITQNAKETGLIQMGLENYIKGRHWLTYYNMMHDDRGEKKIL